MTKRSIIASPREAAALHKGEATAIVRRMEPQPPDWVERFGYNVFTPKGCVGGFGNYGDEGPAQKFFRLPFVRGDVLEFREAWWSDRREKSVVVYDATPEWGKYQNEDRPIRATYANETPVDRADALKQMLPKFWSRKSAATMPDWAVRLRYVIASIEPIRTAEMTPAQLAALGGECNVEGWGWYITLRRAEG